MYFTNLLHFKCIKVDAVKTLFVESLHGLKQLNYESKSNKELAKINEKDFFELEKWFF